MRIDTKLWRTLRTIAEPLRRRRMRTSPATERPYLWEQSYPPGVDWQAEIEIRETLPKTLIGKISKKELIAEGAAAPPKIDSVPATGE